jgi:hypothetical protein
MEEVVDDGTSLTTRTKASDRQSQLSLESHFNVYSGEITVSR